MENQVQIPKINRLKFEGLSFQHENQDPILQNVEYEFPSEETVLIKSLQGAGKSTLLQILAGLIIPTSGKYLINDENMLEMTFEEFLPYRLSIGYTFDYGGLISNRTVYENMILPLLYHKLLDQKHADEKIKNLLKQFDLEKFKDERPAHIPGRIRKIVCLLRAMVIDPQVLLLDDPSVGLGQDISLKFLDLVEQHRKEKNLKHIFITSYDDKFMSLIPHRTIYLDNGFLYNHEEESKRLVNL